MNPPTIEQWITRLEHGAQMVLRETPLFEGASDPVSVADWISYFADELGHRRALDRAVLARLLGTSPGPMPAFPTPDIALWWGQDLQSDSHRGPPPQPIVPQDPNMGIELWTEIELGALHAVWNRVIDRAAPECGVLARQAVEWHVNELQPDNATSHAFGLHGFVICAHERNLSDVWLHADMMLHSTMLGTGKPDRFSACLMLDAARGLRRYLEAL